MERSDSKNNAIELPPRYINTNLLHLPNINQMNDDEIRHTGAMLTKYCDQLS